MGDSYEKIIQDIASELENLQKFEQTLKEDCQMGDDAKKIMAQLQSHKVITVCSVGWFRHIDCYL